MTHDELLTKISDNVDNCLGIMAGAILGDALQAVVELHKPDYEMCMTCELTNYPCPTIQAIEKALS